MHYYDLADDTLRGALGDLHVRREKYFASDSGRAQIAPWVLLETSDGVAQSDLLDPKPYWVDHYRDAMVTGFPDHQREKLTYAIFHNADTDSYVATAADRRNKKFGEVTHPIVDCLVIDGAGRSQGDVMTEAHALWREHFTYLTAFLLDEDAGVHRPLIERAEVDAMHEAQRVRDAGNAPALPQKNLFDVHVAFRVAYPDKAGFGRMLRDVYGLEGSRRQLTDRNIYSCVNGGYRNDDDRIGPRYDIHPEQILKIYEQLPHADQADFRAALMDFITLDMQGAWQKIDDERQAGNYIASVARDLATLKMETDFGTGIRNAFNASGMDFYTQEAIKKIAGDPDPLEFSGTPVALIVTDLRNGSFNEKTETAPDWPGETPVVRASHWFPGG